MRYRRKHLVLQNMCSPSKEQSIYKLSPLKGPEVTRLFTFLEDNFYLQPSLSSYREHAPWYLLPTIKCPPT